MVAQSGRACCSIDINCRSRVCALSLALLQEANNACENRVERKYYFDCNSEEDSAATCFLLALSTGFSFQSNGHDCRKTSHMLRCNKSCVRDCPFAILDNGVMHFPASFLTKLEFIRNSVGVSPLRSLRTILIASLTSLLQGEETALYSRSLDWRGSKQITVKNLTITWLRVSREASTCNAAALACCKPPVGFNSKFSPSNISVVVGPGGCSHIAISVDSETNTALGSLVFSLGCASEQSNLALLRCIEPVKQFFAYHIVGDGNLTAHKRLTKHLCGMC
eukprot:IDg5222t1